MKNIIIAWHTQSDENLFSKNSTLISNDYKLWETCCFDEATKKLEKNPAIILIVASKQQDPQTIKRLLKIGEQYPKLQIVTLFNSQCNKQALSKLCHMLYDLSNKQRPLTQKNNKPTFTLTRRQRQVLSLLSQGYSNKQIANKLYMSEGTVKTHCLAIFRGLGVKNRTQAAMLATNFL